MDRKFLQVFVRKTFSASDGSCRFDQDSELKNSKGSMDRESPGEPIEDGIPERPITLLFPGGFSNLIANTVTE